MKSHKDSEERRRRRDNATKRNLVLIGSIAIGITLCLTNAIYVFHNFRIQSEDTIFHGRSRALIRPEKPAWRTGVITNLNNSVTDTIASTSVDVPPGKERLVLILNEAGYDYLDQESIEKLPTWDRVVQLFGDSPRILGLDTCQAFRESVDPRNAFLAPAGPFNSGTNLLAELLWQNCALPKLRRRLDSSGKRSQTNWGKHNPPRIRLQIHRYKSVNNTAILPVVAVRDPFTWMQSMCRRSYTAFWIHSSQHCPNLVPIEQELKRRKRHGNPNKGPPPVRVRYNSLNTTHTSLVHMWNDWYDEYIQADFPRVFVRMEDLVFHARNVTDTVCQCVGGQLKRKKIVYLQESAKKGDTTKGQYETTLLDAMIRYGSLNRTEGMTQHDAAYARTALHRDLMDMFSYTIPDESMKVE